MFSSAVSFHPGSPQTYCNIQAYPTPKLFDWRSIDTGEGNFILGTDDQPVLDTGDNGVLEA